MSETVVIIDYGSGNLRSVEKAFERAASESGIAANFTVTDDVTVIRGASRIVLPGVGAFSACMEGLKARTGVLEALEHGVLVERKPFLGICVGMQLLADIGHEFGETSGLDWISGEVVPLVPKNEDERVPHMGWNVIEAREHHELLQGVDGEAFYFAHSFHFDTENDAHKISVCGYAGGVTSAVARDNIAGVQFHPEKSQRAGLRVLGNFLNWRPL